MNAYEAGLKVINQNEIFDTGQLDKPWMIWRFSAEIADALYEELIKKASKNQRVRKDKFIYVLCAILSGCSHSKDSNYISINWWSAKGICSEYKINRKTFDTATKLMEKSFLIKKRILGGTYTDGNGQIGKWDRNIYAFRKDTLQPLFDKWISVYNEAIIREARAEFVDLFNQQARNSLYEGVVRRVPAAEGFVKITGVYPVDSMET